MSPVEDKAFPGGEESYRLIVDMAEEGVWLLDKSDCTVFVNKKLIEMLDYREDELVGRSVYDFTDNVNGEILRSALHRRRRGVRETYTVKLQKKDGSFIWVIIAATPLFDKNNQYRGSLGLASDITPLKQAESKLKESEEKFRLVADFTYDWEIYMGRQGELIYVSPSCERMTGYTVEQFLRNPGLLFEIVFPDDRAVFMSHMNASLRERVGPASIDFRIVSKAGEVRWINHICQPVFRENGEWLGTRASNREITERKKAEEALRLTSFSLEHARDLVIWFYPDGRFYYINDSACRRYGYSREELMSRTIFDVNPHYTRETWDDRWNKLRKEGSYFYETENRARDGSLFPIEVSVSYVRYDDLELMCGYARDITERKQAREELQEAKAQAELYLDLMGHDINNINQIAMGFIELSLETLDLNQEQRALLSRPIEALKNSSRLISDVRKLQRAKDETYYQKIDLRTILADLQANYTQVPGRQVTINLTSEHECYVFANELVRDVFSNLINNAIKHSKPDRHLIIDITLWRAIVDDRCCYHISIEDNGPGIPDALKNKLWARSEKGHEKASGRGLGLFIVRSLIVSFHGKVWAEDRVPGDHTRGSRFVVMLPAADN